MNEESFPLDGMTERDLVQFVKLEIQTNAMKSEIEKFFEDPPQDALDLLCQTALGDTGGSRAARNILRWLWAFHGGLELRALDYRRCAAALALMYWWSGPVKSHDPLESVIHKINEAWPAEECPMCRQKLQRPK